MEATDQIIGLTKNFITLSFSVRGYKTLNNFFGQPNTMIVLKAIFSQDRTSAIYSIFRHQKHKRTD